jgi:polyketide synthase PksN
LRHGDAALRLKNIVWAKTFTVENWPQELHIELSIKANRELAFEIYSQPGGPESERAVHCQGDVVLNASIEVPSLNLAVLQAQHRQIGLSPAEHYRALSALGIEYGPGYQGIEATFAGDGQVLAKLSLPAMLAETRTHYLLHPSLLDSAFQASLGLNVGADDRKLFLPFALEELDIVGACAPSMWAWVRRAEGNITGDTLQRLDIDMCDEHGTVQVRIKGFAARALHHQMKPGVAPTSSGTVMLQPHWQARSVVGRTATPGYVERRVIFLDEDTVVFEKR